MTDTKQEYVMRIESNVVEPSQWFVAVVDQDSGTPNGPHGYDVYRPPFIPTHARSINGAMDMIILAAGIDHLPGVVGFDGIPVDFLSHGQFSSDILTPRSRLIIVGRNEGEIPQKLLLEIGGPLVAVGDHRYAEEERSCDSPEKATHRMALAQTRQLYETPTQVKAAQPVDAAPSTETAPSTVS